MDLDPVEIRVLGCLVEKQKTTPDAYPLSLNALRLACNQSTNRDPVVQYDEEMIRGALHRLGRRGWTRLASGAGSRAAKYRHLLDEKPGLAADEQSLLAVLMLRGPQTPGELRARTDRMHHFAGFEALEQTLSGLIDREFVAGVGRRPGQKEERFAHRLGDDLEDAPEHVPAPAAGQASAPPAQDRVGALERRVEALEREVAELRQAARGGS